MIFNELDRNTTTTLCTLSMLMGNNKMHEETLISIGQNLGLSRDETLMVIANWDELDVIEFKEAKDKISFVKHCLVELAVWIPLSQKVTLYNDIAKELGLAEERLN